MVNKELAQIITKKKLNQTLTNAEIKWLVTEYANHRLSETDMGKFLQSLLPNKLTDPETLTMFNHTYQISTPIKFDNISGFKLDKHSTGGIGDKLTLIMLPILTALGIKNFKFSGGRLGYTGGTIEKLQSFPKINLNLSISEFQQKIQKWPLIIAHTNDQICDFETRLYHLRTKSGTANITGLITNSIMIKKILLENDGLILDIKVGSGALFKNLTEAKKFAQLANEIAQKYQRKIAIVFSDMNGQLGYTIGNKWEVWEAIQTLKGHGEPKLMELVQHLIYKSLQLKTPELTKKQAHAMIMEVIENNTALTAFKTFVLAMGGDFDAIAKLPKIETKYQYSISAWTNGYLKFHQIKRLGEYLNKINLLPDGKVDYDTGLVWQKPDGAYFNKHDPIAILYTNQPTPEFSKIFKEIVTITKTPEEPKSKILLSDTIDFETKQ